jgi:hypothetical protein
MIIDCRDFITRTIPRNDYMKKEKKFGTNTIIIVLIGAIFGGFIGLIAIGEIGSPSRFSGLPIYLNLLIAVLTYFLAVSVHEIGHFLTFTFFGVRMKALFLTIFIFIKESGKWRFKFNPNKITAIGGIAVPEIEPVKDEKDFRRLQNIYGKAIMAGPLFTIFYWLITSLVVLPYILNNSNILSSILFTHVASLTVITFFLIAVSFIKSEIAVGDFPAYKLTKTDPFFIGMQLYQNYVFSSEPSKFRRENTFLKNYILDELGNKLKYKDTHIFTLSILDNLLVEYLTGAVDELPFIVKEYLDFLLDNPYILNNKNSEITLLLRFHLVRYLAVSQSLHKGMDLYYQLKSEKTPFVTVKSYLVKQTENFLGIADHTKFLEDKSNIEISSAHGVLKNFEGYYLDEIALNKKAI